MNLVADLIFAIHLCVVCFIILAPFSPALFPVGSVIPGFVLLLECIILPFIVLHWWLNDSTCCLTLLECWVRGIPREESFLHQILDPVYRLVSKDHLDNEFLSKIVLIATILLWLKALYELHKVDFGPLKEVLSFYTRLVS